MKGETRAHYQVQWDALKGFVILGAITVTGMVLNLSSHGYNWLLWDPNMPQVLAFTVFDLWLIFFAGLICIERPSAADPRTIRAEKQGSIRGAVVALVRRTLW